MLDFKLSSRSTQYRRKKKAKESGCSIDDLEDMRGKHQNHAHGEKNGRWNGYKTVSSHGYIKIRVGKEHHLADPNGYAYEHQLIAEEILGRPLAKNETIHHKNKTRADNRPENIEIITKSSHAILHTSERIRDRFGRLTEKELPEPLRDSKTGRYLGGYPDKRNRMEEWPEELRVRQWPEEES